GTRLIRKKLQTLTGVAPDADAAEVIVRTHEALAAAPSAILTATLDDALAVTERPNMPGTIDQWPNWSIALPVPLEEIEQALLPRAVARALSNRAKKANPILESDSPIPSPGGDGQGEGETST